MNFWFVSIAIHSWFFPTFQMERDCREGAWSGQMESKRRVWLKLSGNYGCSAGFQSAVSQNSILLNARKHESMKYLEPRPLRAMIATRKLPRRVL
jgi:hypothetical protein